MRDVDWTYTSTRSLHPGIRSSWEDTVSAQPHCEYWRRPLAVCNYSLISLVCSQAVIVRFLIPVANTSAGDISDHHLIWGDGSKTDSKKNHKYMHVVMLHFLNDVNQLVVTNIIQ